MDDLRAFEAQLARVLQQAAGPSRPTDVATVVRTVTARSPRWSVPATFSATKFVVAASIVALFGGLLLAGVMTEPIEKAVPALSPSPATTPDRLRAMPSPSAGLVTEPVAPGVVRVLSDGAGHDLASLGVDDIAVGADGAVWMTASSGLFRLGQPGMAPVRGDPSYRNLTVANDGTVWAGVGDPSSYDGERWSSSPGYVARWAVRPDGTVWGVRPDANYFSEEGREPPGFVLSRIEDGRWTTVDLVGWPRRAIGDGSAPYGPGLVATADGSLWLIARRGDEALLVRYDGTRWKAVETPFDPALHFAAPDGSLWIIDRREGAKDGRTQLASYRDGAWTRSALRGIPHRTHYGDEDTLRPRVGSDGAVWLRLLKDGDGLPERCDGLARVVGGSWTPFLPGACIAEIALGPYGEAWVATVTTWTPPMSRPEPGDVYLIRPDEGAP